MVDRLQGIKHLIPKRLRDLTMALDPADFYGLIRYSKRCWRTRHGFPSNSFIFSCDRGWFLPPAFLDQLVFFGSTYCVCLGMHI
jgi:hypothetical protein